MGFDVMLRALYFIFKLDIALRLFQNLLNFLPPPTGFQLSW